MSINKKIFIAISLGFVIGLNIYFRSFCIYFPQLKRQAFEIVKSNIHRTAIQKINEKFPQYDPIAKDKLLKETIKNYNFKSQEIKKQINDIYRSLKDRFSDDNFQTYLMELDCWHWARYVENTVYLGHPGDRVINGKQFDDYMLAPKGTFLLWDNFLFYFSSILYKIFSIFKFVPIYNFCFYLPLFFIFLFILVLFFFTFRLGRYICAISSCIFIGLFGPFIPRSSAGWFDKDILNLLFPILIIFTYAYSYDFSKRKTKLFFIFLSSFFVGLFCFTWLNWWFVFLLIIIYEIISIFIILFLNWYYKNKEKEILKEHIFNSVFFFLFSIFWIIVFCRFEPFLFIYRQIKEVLKLTKPLIASIWPNVYYTVGELKRTSLKEIINTSGIGFFIFGVFSMIILFFYNLFKKDSYKKTVSIVLFLWFISMLSASLTGVRFIVFLSVPLGIFLGWFLSYIFEYFKKKNYLEINILIILIMVVLLYTTINRAYKISESIFPLMNDSWYKFLKAIENTTPKNSILNSWWDFGDWFKVVAKRRVIFDGQSQNMPQAYWMAKALLSSDEKESLAILRMLNNGGNDAFDIIDEYLKEPLHSVLLLETVLKLEKEKAKEILLDYLPKETTDKVLSLLFDKPKDAYFIVDYSLCPKITAISYLGNWNFSKVYIAKNIKEKEKEEIIDYLVELGKDRQEVKKLYQEAFIISDKDIEVWLSGPLQFYSGVIKGKDRGDVVLFDNGFIYNKKEKSIYSSSGYIPRSVFFEEDNQIKEVIFPNANLVFSVLVFKKNDIYNLVCLDRQLGRSLFVKLYFLGGFSLKHFKPHIDVYDLDGYLGSYKIDW